jgi:hypothetical protein
MRVNLLHPNKTDVVPFLDSGAKEPDRYARATVVSGTEELYWQEYMVGPLPATNTTAIHTLTYPFTNSQPGKTVINPVYSATDGAQFQEKFGLEVEDITRQLWNTVRISKAYHDARLTVSDIRCRRRRHTLRHSILGRRWYHDLMGHHVGYTGDHYRQYYSVATRCQREV